MANKEWELTQNMMLGQFTADDDRWVTINGTHVLIGEGGEIKGGPDGIKEHYAKKSGGSGKSASVNAHGTMDPESLGKAEKRRDALWDKEDHGTISKAEKKELKELQGKIDEHYSTKKEKTGADPNASAGPKDPAKMTEKEIIAEISKHDAEARAAMNNHNKTKAEAAASRESAARAHELRKELDRRWAAGEKAHGIKGGFENAGKSSGAKSSQPKSESIKKAGPDYIENHFKKYAPKGKIFKNKETGEEYFVAKHFHNDIGWFKNFAYLVPVKYQDNAAKAIRNSNGIRVNAEHLKRDFTDDAAPSAWDLTERMMVGDFNPYHDEDGRFTTAGGGSDYDDDEDDEEENEDVSALKSITEGQWWGRRSDLEEELADAGFDVLESNAEWIDVASPNQGSDAQYMLRLGGTERTVTVNSIETLDYNPNHDPDDGRFTSGSGGSGSGTGERLGMTALKEAKVGTRVITGSGKIYEKTDDKDLPWHNIEDRHGDKASSTYLAQSREAGGVTLYKGGSASGGKMKDPAGYFNQASKMSGLKPLLDQMDKASKDNVSKAVYRAAASPDGRDATLSFGRKSVKVTTPSKEKGVAKQYGIHWTDRRGIPNASMHGEANDLATHLLITLKNLGYNGEQITIK